MRSFNFISALVALVIVQCWFAPTASRADGAAASGPQWWIVVVKHTTDMSKLDPAATQQAMLGHVAYLDSLYDQGLLYLAGPTLDESALGFAVVQGDSAASVKAAFEADPAAQAGLFSITEIHPWWPVFNKGAGQRLTPEDMAQMASGSMPMPAMQSGNGNMSMPSGVPATAPCEIGVLTTVKDAPRACTVQVFNSRGMQIQQERTDKFGVAYVQGLVADTYTLKFLGSEGKLYAAVRTIKVKAGTSAHLEVDLDAASDPIGQTQASADGAATASATAGSPPMTTGGLNFIEFPSKNVKESKAFYSKLFGWDFDSMASDPALSAMGDSFALFTAPGGMLGAFNAGPHFTPTTDGPIVYITCDSVKAKLGAVMGAGGQTLLASMKLPGDWGWIGVFIDPHGNKVGLWSEGE